MLVIKTTGGYNNKTVVLGRNNATTEAAVGAFMFLIAARNSWDIRKWKESCMQINCSFQSSCQWAIAQRNLIIKILPLSFPGLRSTSPTIRSIDSVWREIHAAPSVSRNYSIWTNRPSIYLFRHSPNKLQLPPRGIYYVHGPSFRWPGLRPCRGYK